MFRSVSRTVTRRRTLDVPTSLDAELLGAARELFRAAFADVRERDRGVRLIGVAATNLPTVSAPDLFEPAARARLRRLTDAVDRVRDKYGFDAVTPGSRKPRVARGEFAFYTWPPS